VGRLHLESWYFNGLCRAGEDDGDESGLSADAGVGVRGRERMLSQSGPLAIERRRREALTAYMVLSASALGA